MKFQAKQVQNQTNVMMTLNSESCEVTITTEDEDSDEEGTGNTGKPKRPRCWAQAETIPRESDEQVFKIDETSYLETA